MKDLIKNNIENKDLNTPEINFNAKTGDCYLSGTSFMENPEEYYKPITEWVYLFIKEQNFVNVIFELSYYNSGSSKAIYDFLTKLKVKENGGAKIVVKWVIENWDEDIKDDIEGLKLDTNIDIKIIRQ